MANSIQLQCGMTSTIDNMNFNGNASVSQTTVSSNAIGSSVTLNNSTWTQIPMDDITDALAVWIFNDNTVYSSSVITVATGSAGQNVLAKVQSGYPALIPWTGSLSLYGKITSGDDTTAVIQMISQQS